MTGIIDNFHVRPEVELVRGGSGFVEFFIFMTPRGRFYSIIV